MPMRNLALALALSLAAAAPASAHHAQAMFERTKPVTLKGVIKSFEYMNPHAWLQLTAQGPSGKTEDWSLEVESPAVLSRAGIGARDFVVGERVTVVAYPLRDGRPGGSLVTMTRPDGTVLDPRKALGR